MSNTDISIQPALTVPKILGIAASLGLGYCLYKLGLESILKARRLTEEDIVRGIKVYRKELYYMHLTRYFIARDLYYNAQYLNNPFNLQNQHQYSMFVAQVEDKSAFIYSEVDKNLEKMLGYEGAVLANAINKLVQNKPELWVEEINPDRDNISNLIVWDFYYMQSLPHSLTPPTPKIPLSHPLLSVKQAEEILLNFYADSIQEWINFVKENTFSFKIEIEIKKQFVKKYYQIVSGKSMAAAFTKLVGGQEVVDQLDFHPLQYVFSALGDILMTNEAFVKIESSCYFMLYAVYTKCMKKEACTQLSSMYSTLDGIKVEIKQYFMTKYPEDYVVPQQEEVVPAQVIGDQVAQEDAVVVEQQVEVKDGAVEEEVKVAEQNESDEKPESEPVAN